MGNEWLRYVPLRHTSQAFFLVATVPLSEYTSWDRVQQLPWTKRYKLHAEDGRASHYLDHSSTTELLSCCLFRALNLCMLLLQQPSIYINYSCPLLSTWDWFQDPPWIRKSTDAQVPWSAFHIRIHGSTSADSTNRGSRSSAVLIEKKSVCK